MIDYTDTAQRPDSLHVDGSPFGHIVFCRHGPLVPVHRETAFVVGGEPVWRNKWRPLEDRENPMVDNRPIHVAMQQTVDTLRDMSLQAVFTPKLPLANPNGATPPSCGNSFQDQMRIVRAWEADNGERCREVLENVRRDQGKRQPHPHRRPDGDPRAVGEQRSPAPTVHPSPFAPNLSGLSLPYANESPNLRSSLSGRTQGSEEVSSQKSPVVAWGSLLAGIAGGAAAAWAGMKVIQAAKERDVRHEDDVPQDE